MFIFCIFFFFFKQKTAYEVRISDWSSDVCSSDLEVTVAPVTTYDASLAYEKGSVELRLWARNLTNERYIVTANDVTAFFYLSPTSANANTSSFLVNYSQPRTFGITGTWRY